MAREQVIARGPSLAEIGADIVADSDAQARAGLKAAAALIPEFLDANFVDQGTRGKGGRNRWARLTRRSITYRKTWPAGGSEAEQERYYANHQPLQDTGTLRRSFPSDPRIQGSGELIFTETTSDTAYGWRHEYGEGTTPDGAPIWARPHMYIVEGTDTVRVDSAFEGAWS